MSVLPVTTARNLLSSKENKRSVFYTKVVRRGEDRAIIVFPVRCFHVFHNVRHDSDLGQEVERVEGRKRKAEDATHVLQAHALSVK